MLHEESRPFLPIPALDMAEEGIEELDRRIIRSAQEGVNTSRANVASNVSTPDEELRRRFKNEIRKEAEQALVGANLRSGVIYLSIFFFLLLCFFGSRGKKITPDSFI